MLVLVMAFLANLIVTRTGRNLAGPAYVGLFASLLVAMTAAVAQSYTSGKNQLKPIQFVFNACTLLNAAGLAYLVYHSQMFAAHASAHTMSLVLAAVTYFLANTAPVASIIGLTEGGNPFALWHKVFLWSFPNYVIGAGLTAIASAFTTVSGLATMAALMVVLFAVYQSYKTYVSQAQQTQPKAMTMAMSAGR